MQAWPLPSPAWGLLQMTGHTAGLPHLLCSCSSPVFFLGAPLHLWAGKKSVRTEYHILDISAFTAWIWILTHTSYVTLSKLPNFSVPVFSCEMGK